MKRYRFEVEWIDAKGRTRHDVEWTFAKDLEWAFLYVSARYKSFKASLVGGAVAS